MNIKQALEGTRNLTANEKAFLAHCLISSLETCHDENVDDEWAKLAEQRFNQLESGEVEPVSWDDIKKEIRG